MSFRQPAEIVTLHEDPHQHEVIFGSPIRFAVLGEDCNGQGPGEEDDQALESMNIALALMLKKNGKFHGEGVEMVMCANRLGAVFDTKVEGFVDRKSS